MYILIVHSGSEWYGCTVCTCEVCRYICTSQLHGHRTCNLQEMGRKTPEDGEASGCNAVDRLKSIGVPVQRSGARTGACMSLNPES